MDLTEFSTLAREMLEQWIKFAHILNYVDAEKIFEVYRWAIIRQSQYFASISILKDMIYSTMFPLSMPGTFQSMYYDCFFHCNYIFHSVYSKNDGINDCEANHGDGDGECNCWGDHDNSSCSVQCDGMVMMSWSHPDNGGGYVRV